MIEVAFGVFLGHLLYNGYVSIRMSIRKKKRDKIEVGKGLKLDE